MPPTCKCSCEPRVRKPPLLSVFPASVIAVQLQLPTWQKTWFLPLRPTLKPVLGHSAQYSATTHSITRASEWPLCAAEVRQRQKERGGREGGRVMWRAVGAETQMRR